MTFYSIPIVAIFSTLIGCALMGFNRSVGDDAPPCTEQDALNVARSFMNEIGAKHSLNAGVSVELLEGGGSPSEWEVRNGSLTLHIEPWQRFVTCFRVRHANSLQQTTIPAEEWKARTTSQVLDIARSFSNKFRLGWIDVRVESGANDFGREYATVTDSGFIDATEIHGGNIRWRLKIDRPSGVVLEFEQRPPPDFQRRTVRLTEVEASEIALQEYRRMRPRTTSAPRPSSRSLAWERVTLVGGKPLMTTRWQPQLLRLGYRFMFDDGRLAIVVDASDGNVIGVDECNSAE